MLTVAVWLLATAACAMLLVRRTRNAGFFAISGAILALLFHYNIATIPEVRNLACLLWGAALLLIVSRVRSSRQGRTA